MQVRSDAEASQQATSKVEADAEKRHRLLIDEREQFKKEALDLRTLTAKVLVSLWLLSLTLSLLRTRQYDMEIRGNLTTIERHSLEIQRLAGELEKERNSKETISRDLQTRQSHVAEERDTMKKELGQLRPRLAQVERDLAQVMADKASELKSSEIRLRTITEERDKYQRDVDEMRVQTTKVQHRHLASCVIFSSFFSHLVGE